MLALLRHLESRHGSDGQLPVQAELRELCVKLLASPELKVSRSKPSMRDQPPIPIASLVQVRQASAEAIASLTPKHIRYRTCLDMLGATRSNHNQWHGSLLVVLAILNLGIDLDTQKNEHLVQTSRALGRGTEISPLIMATITAIIGQCGIRLNKLVLDGETMHTLTPEVSQQPGLSLWQNASSKLLARTEPSNSQRSIAALHQALLPGVSPDERIEALQDTSAVKEAEDAEEGSSELYRKLRTLYDVTGHIPLKEAILPALAARVVGDNWTVWAGARILTQTDWCSRTNIPHKKPLRT